MSNIKHSAPPKKDDDRFDDFIENFFESMITVQDPGDADETLADLTTKFNNLIASMREAGLMR
jgi:hypothetical protein